MYFCFKNIGNFSTLPEEITINKEWLDKDEIKIKEILPLLYGILNINDFLNNNNFNNAMDKAYKWEYGLGYSRTIFRPSGGYVRIYVSILTDINNNSIESSISIDGKKYVMEILEKKFNLSKIKESNVSYFVEDMVISIRHRNETLYGKFINDYDKYFQINNEIYIPDEIKTEYEILFNAGMYIYRVGLAGNKFPEEREALEKILEMNNKNILFAILSSYSPQARMYAIEGLFQDRIHDIVKENEYTDILNKIVALETNIRTSYGDVIHETKIYSIEDIYNIINNKY